MKIKNYFLLVMLLVVVGCASQKINIISESGEPMPNPYYVATSTSGIPIKATYYYVGFSEVKDADGSIHHTPVYLDRRTKYTIKKGRYKDLQLVLRVFNPTSSTYRVHTHITVQRKNKKSELTNGVSAMSELSYRQYMFRLPIGGDEKQIKFDVSLTNKDDKETYLHTGAFVYQIH